MNLLQRSSSIFGSRNERELKRIAPLVRAINAREPELEKQIGRGAPRGDRPPQGAARGRRDARRPPARGVRARPRDEPATPPPGAEKGLRHFDVQLVGGIVLHQGKIAEMVTGEGKTLVATLPAYLNALAGQGRPRRHGERLPRAARREWMGPIYERLGLTVGVIQADMDHRAAQARLRLATSPTARTTSSGSTTCATT